MTISQNCLKAIGIESVPEGLTASFTDVNRSTLKIEVPGREPVSIELKVTGQRGEARVKRDLADTLVKLGAKRAPV